jgi:hypothetical protein
VRRRWEIGEVIHFDLGRFTVFPLDGLVHFFAVYGDGSGGGDTEADFVAADIDDGDFDVIADHDGFIALAR